MSEDRAALIAEQERLVEAIQRLAIAGRGNVGKDGLDALIERQNEIEQKLKEENDMT